MSISIHKTWERGVLLNRGSVGVFNPNLTLFMGLNYLSKRSLLWKHIPPHIHEERQNTPLFLHFLITCEETMQRGIYYICQQKCLRINGICF